MRPPKQSPAPLLLYTDYMIYLDPKANEIYFSLLKIHHDCGFKLWGSIRAYPKCLHLTSLVLSGSFGVGTDKMSRIDSFLSASFKVDLCLECIEWAKSEKRTFLRQALEVGLRSQTCGAASSPCHI